MLATPSGLDYCGCDLSAERSSHVEGARAEVDVGLAVGKHAIVSCPSQRLN
jgi:hypothetical protein